MLAICQTCGKEMNNIKCGSTIRRIRVDQYVQGVPYVQENVTDLYVCEECKDKLLQTIDGLKTKGD